MKKKCACCGRIHREIPKSAKSSDMGTFWNCSCNSTLFVPSLLTSITTELARIRKKRAA